VLGEQRIAELCAAHGDRCVQGFLLERGERGAQCHAQLPCPAHQAGDAELWVTKSTSHLGSFGVEPRAYSERVI